MILRYNSEMKQQVSSLKVPVLYYNNTALKIYMKISQFKT